MKLLNVLLTAASRRVPLVRAFQASPGTLGLTGRVVVADLNPRPAAVAVGEVA